MRRDLVQWLGPVGRLVFVAPLGGLVLSMSWGPMLLFLLLCAGYFVVERMPRLSLALPATALTLILIHFAGTPIFVIAQNAIAQVAPDRAASLQYRVDALDEYSSVILARPCFGFGTQGDGRIQGRATDSQALISLLRAGFIGTFFYFGWYVLALWSAIGVAERTRGTVFFRRALGACLVGGLGLAVTVIDAGLDLWMILTLAPMVSLYAWLKDQPPRLAPAPPRFVPARSIS